MPWHPDPGEKIRPRPSGCGLRMCGPEVAIRVSGLREVLELGEDADFLPDEDGKVQPDMTSPAPLTHKNIRGREYYRKDKQ